MSKSNITASIEHLGVNYTGTIDRSAKDEWPVAVSTAAGLRGDGVDVSTAATCEANAAPTHDSEWTAYGEGRDRQPGHVARTVYLTGATNPERRMAMVTVKISPRASTAAAVRAVEEAIMTERVSVGDCPPIIVRQAFPYYIAGFTGDPWSPNYPRVYDVQREAAKIGVSLEVEEA